MVNGSEVLAALQSLRLFSPCDSAVLAALQVGSSPRPSTAHVL